MEPPIISKRVRHMIDLAKKASFLCSSEQTFKLGAVIAKGGRVLSFGVNNFKRYSRDPKLMEKAHSTQTCAETAAAFRAIGNSNEGLLLKGCLAYVVRRKSNGKLAMAKPCGYCQRVLSDAGVKGVFYTNQEGKIEYLKL